MATLVQFLAAGVKGAESGSATFVLRGTASSAASVLYNDFEATTQPGTNIITLDANGAAEVYCDAYCDVTLKNSAGTTLRTVTIGNSAPLVEVQSASFTGTDYDNSPANTAGEPVTLKVLLDRWITSAGTTDFKVLLNGVSTNLSAAFASFSQLFFNVKDPAYGAEGDGVTDDTTAILAAVAAADGAIVYFPPGTYIVTNLNPAQANVYLLGSGQDSTILRANGGSAALLFGDATVGAKKIVQDIGIDAAAGTTNIVHSLVSNQNISFLRCRFDMSSGNFGALAIGIDDTAADVSLSFDDCDWLLTATDIAVSNQSTQTNIRVSVSNCRFVTASNYTGETLVGRNFAVSHSVFDASLVVAGSYTFIRPYADNNTINIGNVSNCRFIDGGSGGFVFDFGNQGGSGSDNNFGEVNNSFEGFVQPVLEGSGQIYGILGTDLNASALPGRISLGSRLGKILQYDYSISADGSNLDVLAAMVAEQIVVFVTTGTVLNVSMSLLPPGCSAKVFIVNNSGGNINVTVNSLGNISPDFSFTGVTVDEAVVIDYTATLFEAGNLKVYATAASVVEDN